MTTNIFIPDPFLSWLWKQSIRASATCVALGIVAFLLSIVFRALALMIDALHAVFHSVHVFCISLNHVYLESGLVGQFLMCLILLSVLLWIIIHGGRSLCQSWRTGK